MARRTKLNSCAMPHARLHLPRAQWQWCLVHGGQAARQQTCAQAPMRDKPVATKHDIEHADLPGPCPPLPPPSPVLPPPQPSPHLLLCGLASAPQRLQLQHLTSGCRLQAALQRLLVAACMAY
jgi:hypothetical protein